MFNCHTLVTITHIFDDNWCEECGSKFTTNQYLQQHKDKLHRGKGFTCGEVGCGKIFQSKESLSKHIRHVHQKIKDKQCKLCGKHLTDITSLRKHIISKHPEQAPKNK